MAGRSLGLADHFQASPLSTLSHNNRVRVSEASSLRVFCASPCAAASMLPTAACFLHSMYRMRGELAAARQRTPWLEGDPAATAAAAPLLGPSLVDLASFDPRHPARFYLPGNSCAMEQLSDCFAVVGGARLPLHGQLLAAQAAVLRDMFVALAQSDDDSSEGSAASTDTEKSGPAELSAAFSGCSLLVTAVFLRFVYSPDHATPGSLRAVHRHSSGSSWAGREGALLAGLAGLAHRLDAAGLLAKIEAYLRVASATASISELLASVQLAEVCHLGALADTCLALLARKMAAAGPYWHEQVRPEQLAACSSASLASLACKMAGTVSAGAFSPPAVHNVLPGRGGRAGGFTWVIPRFSKQQGRVTSPWVEVGGVQWRLKVWPRGDDAAGGTHLSAYLECNYAQAQAWGLASIEAFYDFTFLDQSEEGLHYNVDCGKDVFTANTQNWGKTRMMPLEELARADRSYLSNDRLAARISIRVLPPASAGAAAAAAGSADAAADAAAALQPAAVEPPVPPL